MRSDNDIKNYLRKISFEKCSRKKITRPAPTSRVEKIPRKKGAGRAVSKTFALGAFVDHLALRVAILDAELD